MIYYKFLHKADFLKRLNVSKAGFVRIYCPVDGASEDYCYAEIKEEDFRDFTDYFGQDGELVNPDDEDWPDSLASNASGRSQAFSVINQP